MILKTRPLCQEGDGLKTAVVAGDIRNGGITREYELVDIERLTCQEKGGDEGVSRAQFGIDGLHHFEPHIPQVSEDAPSVGQPGHLDRLTGLQVLRVDTLRDKRIAATVFAFFQAVGIILPIARTDIPGKDIERGEPGVVGAFHVAP